MLSAKRKLLLNLKNIPGWTSNRKIVVFSVDDYGNIRMLSREARENLKKAGLDVEQNRFDQYDALENKEDLTALFETLTSVKDKNGRNAVFTAFALPANIDFDKVKSSGYSQYFYQLLPDTFLQIPGYEGTWDLWQEGIAKRLLVPQFHGREHLNIKCFNQLLKENNKEIRACIDNRSYGGISSQPFRQVSYTAAFSFEAFQENEEHKKVIKDGLDAFEKVFGFKAKNFIAPGANDHRCLEKSLAEGGIWYIDTNLVNLEHQGNGRYKRLFNFLGKQNKLGQTYLIRNSVFEPLLNRSVDWVDVCLAEIEIAFKRNKPANISTHRVNFAGQIEPKVRENGLAELRRLLKSIVKKWPEVEFMTSEELGDLISSSKEK